MSHRSYQECLDLNFPREIYETFHSICQTTAILDCQYQRVEALSNFDGVSGFIGLAGSSCGSVTLHMPSVTACAVIGRMSGMSFPVVDSDVADGIGELTNIIAGRAKYLLRKGGYIFEISLPKVAFGSSYAMTQDFKVPCIVFEFSSDIGSFLVDVTLI